MTSGLGVDPTKSGSTITSGTSSQDIQRIFGGLYSPGLISGGAVSTSPTTMSYTTTAGVAIVKMATGLNVPIPVPATTITALSAPSSGSRTDIVYAQQRTPAIEGDSEVIVNYGSVLPQRAVALQTFVQPAGASNSAAGAVSGNVVYSVPYGASLGELFYYQHTTNGILPSAFTRIGYGSFYLPTDRMVTFKVSATMSGLGTDGQGAVGFDNSRYSEFGFIPHYSGPSGTNDFVLWTTPGLHQAWATYHFEATIPLSAGSYTTNLITQKMVGPGNSLLHFGPDANGYGRRGLEYSIRDAGVWSR